MRLLALMIAVVSAISLNATEITTWPLPEGATRFSLYKLTANGETVENTSVTLSGSLKLVKEGEGTFVAAKSNQTYVNGLEIVSGTAKTALGINANKPWGAPDKTSNAITIDADGTLDVNGLYDYGHYNIILNGGTLANHGADLVNGSAKGYWCCGAVTLRANSTFDVVGSLRHNKNAESYTIDLGGKTLSVAIESGRGFYLNQSQLENGTFDILSGGWFGVKAALKLKPDVIVMDILMPVKNGVEATREIKAALPDAKILILTTSTSANDLSAALKAGATGLIPKTTSNATLLSAIRSVAAGKRTVTNEISEIIAADPPIQGLTEHQLDMLASIVRGLTNSEIARQFGISIPSVKDHINAIFSKLGAANRTEAVTIALRKHLLKI